MTKLIMIRHGESIANKEGRFAGHSDYELSELGFEQARRAGKYIKDHYQVDVVYASDLKRAFHTALPTAELFGLEAIPDEGLRELYVGEWETLHHLEVAKRYPEDFNTWMNDFSNARCTGGESIRELYDRIVPHVLKIASENEEKTVVIATHSTPVRAFECYAMGLPPERIDEAPTPVNASICVFNVENGHATVEKFNITDHIEDMITQPAFKY
jgi:broad specificity phosphatase PhoE